MSDDEPRFVPEPIAQIMPSREERRSSQNKKRGGPKKPRPVTEQYLKNVAVWYVGRYMPCTGQLRRALMKRVRRGINEHGGDMDEALAWVEVIIARQVEIGTVNDAEYARAWANSYHRRGVALRDIRYRLRGKSLSASIVDAAMRELEESFEGDPDLAAACAYVRRRRFGPFRHLPEQRAARAQKDLAAMMRAGHRYTHIKRVLACEDLDAFDRLKAEADGTGEPEIF
ncbi:MAG: regulatory protein [Myxococcota bacterium]